MNDIVIFSGLGELESPRRNENLVAHICKINPLRLAEEIDAKIHWYGQWRPGKDDKATVDINLLPSCLSHDPYLQSLIKEKHGFEGERDSGWCAWSKMADNIINEKYGVLKEAIRLTKESLCSNYDPISHLRTLKIHESRFLSETQRLPEPIKLLVEFSLSHGIPSKYGESEEKYKELTKDLLESKSYSRYELRTYEGYSITFPDSYSYRNGYIRHIIISNNKIRLCINTPECIHYPLNSENTGRDELLFSFINWSENQSKTLQRISKKVAEKTVCFYGDQIATKEYPDHTLKDLRWSVFIDFSSVRKKQPTDIKITKKENGPFSKTAFRQRKETLYRIILALKVSAGGMELELKSLPHGTSAVYLGYIANATWVSRTDSDFIQLQESDLINIVSDKVMHWLENQDELIN